MGTNIYDERNTLNDLTGSEWKFSTKTVISKPYPINMQHKLRSEHGGQKPPELCADIIKIFTKRENLVLDPFMGSGTTALASFIEKRKFIGAEIQQEYYDLTVKRINDALVGEIKVREDKPVMTPNKNAAVAKLPEEFRLIREDQNNEK